MSPLVKPLAYNELIDPDGMTDMAETAGHDRGMGRRRLLRSAVLVGAGAMAVSVASITLAGTAQAATTGNQPN